MIYRIFGLLLVLFLSACSPNAGTSGSADKSAFQGTDITGVDWGKELRLTDHHGTRRSLADFHGKVVVLFFGYTHCPDVCPTTLGELGIALKRLGADAGKVQVLYVTLDPARDTPAVMAQYVPSFNPTFLGMTGSDAEIAQAAKDFHVYYKKQESTSKAGYTMDHSANTFVIDPQGRLRLLFAFGAGAGPLVHDIQALLAGK
jgi:protein SCO1/2